MVGNVTVPHAGPRRQPLAIANVAVTPSHTPGAASSRRLMQAALAHAAECSGQWAVLQVYARNKMAPAALYESLRALNWWAAWLNLHVPRTPHIDRVGSLPRLVAFSAGNWQPLYGARQIISLAARCSSGAPCARRVSAIV